MTTKKFKFRKRRKGESRKAHQRAYHKAYQKSSWGKARWRAYEKSPKGKMCRRVYRKSPKVKARHKAYMKVYGKTYMKVYQKSTRYKARRRAYRSSSKGIARRKAYENSPKGIARRKAQQNAYRKSPKGRALRRLIKDKNKTARKNRPGHFTPKEVEARLKLVGQKDWRTGKFIKDLSWDHIVPLKHPKSTNWIWNILPLSRKNNEEKNAKDVYQWIVEGIRKGISLPPPKTMRLIAFAYKQQLGRTALQKAQQFLKGALCIFTMSANASPGCCIETRY